MDYEITWRDDESAEIVRQIIVTINLLLSEVVNGVAAGNTVEVRGVA